MNEDGVRPPPNATDACVGARIRMRRKALGLSQQELGKAIGASLGQTLKYERGAARVGAHRLVELSRVLDVPVSFFFGDIDSSTLASDGAERGRPVDLAEAMAWAIGGEADGNC